MGFIDRAQAQSKEEEDKKKKERPPEKRPPPPPPPKAPPPPPPKVVPPPPKAVPPPPPPPKAPPPPPAAKTPPPPPPPRSGPPPVEKGPPLPDKKGPATQFQKAPPEKFEKKEQPAAKPGDPLPPVKEEGIRRTPRNLAVPPPQGPSGPQGVAPPPPGAPRGPLPPAAKSPGPGPGIGLPAPKRFEDLRKDRRERVEEGGRRKVIVEGDRQIVKENNRAVIRHDESERFSRRPGARSERRADGNVETFYVRPDGVRIVTVVDGNGRLIRRYRRDRDGRERNIIDNRRFYRNLGVGIGIGVIGGIIALNLPPPRITIPRERYIVDYDRASDDDLYETLEAAPIERLDRAYSLEEIRDNYELRARVRRIDLDTINFEFGSWEVGSDQSFKLERIARAILRLLRRNSEAVVMIEGHTDAVGSDEDNLSLSDRRASAVADILTEEFDVPAENLVTQGYGEQHLKIDTQGPEPRNRRVTILNITGLMEER